MYHKILLGLLFLIVIYLLYQNYNIQREIYKIKNSFEELNNFLDLSIKKTKPKVLDTLSSINTTDITDNIVTYSNDVKRVPPEATVNSEEHLVNEGQDNNEENEDNKEIEIVHLQDTSDSDMGSFNLRVFNNIKNSLVTELNTSSSNEEVMKDINNLVVLSPENLNVSETASSETASSKTASSETASSETASSETASSETASSKSASSKNESLKKIEAAVIKMVESSPKQSPTQSPTKLSESSPKNLNKKIYTSEELNKLTIINIKEIAKQLNIVLSVTGKLKNKATLISDILRLQE
jgi:hypothetical protein